MLTGTWFSICFAAKRISKTWSAHIEVRVRGFIIRAHLCHNVAYRPGCEPTWLANSARVPRCWTGADTAQPAHAETSRGAWPLAINRFALRNHKVQRGVSEGNSPGGNATPPLGAARERAPAARRRQDVHPGTMDAFLRD